MLRKVYTCRESVVVANSLSRRCYTAGHEGPCHQPLRRPRGAGSTKCPGPGAHFGAGVGPSGRGWDQLRRHHVGARRISRNSETASGSVTRILRNPDERWAARHGLHPVVRAAPSRLLWPVPAAWSAEEGAAFPVNYFTAYFAYWKAGLLEKSPAPVYVRPPEDLDDLLTDLGKEQRAGSKQRRVLIHAVAGGVGTAAVQIGKRLGIEMFGTSSSEEKLARVKTLGLQHGINFADIMSAQGGYPGTPKPPLVA